MLNGGVDEGHRSTFRHPSWEESLNGGKGEGHRSRAFVNDCAMVEAQQWARKGERWHHEGPPFRVFQVKGEGGGSAVEKDVERWHCAGPPFKAPTSTQGRK
ncbi:hypothetical protein Taro_021524 [Colocasia esculenta]|uniref:Uncharacterized protein n=1 Tax=Colocasia esculenta TaxID=4460 RepID=A0A843URQ1_COLES|nr:hypothetical protein [Colocasia esculenta]